MPFFSLKCLFMAFLLKWRNMSLQVSGISTEIFKQIETVENDHDASTAAALEAVERRGEMVVRVIEPRQMGRQASEAAKKFIAMQVGIHIILFNSEFLIRFIYKH